MANMSYCRWQNTATDLADCVAHLEDGKETLSSEERAAQLRIFDMAKEIVEWAEQVED